MLCDGPHAITRENLIRVKSYQTQDWIFFLEEDSSSQSFLKRGKDSSDWLNRTGRGGGAGGGGAGGGRGGRGHV